MIPKLFWEITIPKTLRHADQLFLITVIFEKWNRDTRLEP